MQLNDPDPNVEIQHCYVTWFIDPIGRALNKQYRLEIAEEFYRQLAFYKYPDLLKACKNVSLNIDSKNEIPNELGACDINLNLPSILSSLDTSTSPNFQQVEVETKVENQIPKIPQVNGWVRYECKLQQPSFSISLHAVNLKILQARFEFKTDSKKILAAKSTSYDSQLQVVHFWFEEQIPAQVLGDFLIEFQFDLESRWYGMYVVNPSHVPDPYEEEDAEDEEEGKSNQEKRKKQHLSLLEGSNERVVATQFESNGARRAFPCFDLPTRKGHYTIRVISTAEIDFCVSNMSLRLFRILSEGNGLQIWEFEPTPLLPTYLLSVVLATKNYFVTLKRELKLINYDSHKREGNQCIDDCPSQCCSFTSPDTLEFKNLTLRMIVPKNRVEEGNFALGTAVEIWVYFWNYFRIVLPMRKLDSIALPFLRPGAMENYGCMTFREREIVPLGLHHPTDVSLTSRAQRQGSAKIIAHEMAHQWTGDIITCQGWPQLWVNESLATYLSHKAIEAIRPEWLIWARFISSEVKMVQEMDWNSWSPLLDKKCKLIQGQDPDCLSVIPFPRNRSVVTPDYFFKDTTHIEAVFDGITYSKGAAVLRTLENLVGEKRFRTIIHHFIHENRWRFGSWALFQKILNHECSHCQPLVSFPTLMSIKPLEIKALTVATIMQPFFLEPGFPILYLEVSLNQKSINLNILDGKGKKVEGNGTWFLPLFHNDLKKESLVFHPHVRQWTITFESKEHIKQFLKVNRDGAGYYITLYNTEGYNLLGEMIQNNENLSRLDKIHLLTDMFFGLRRELVSFATVTKLALSYQKERDTLVLFYWFTTFREITLYFRFVPKMNLYCKLLTQQFFEGLVESSTNDLPFFKLIKNEVRAWIGVHPEYAERIVLDVPHEEEEQEEDDETELPELDQKVAPVNIDVSQVTLSLKEEVSPLSSISLSSQSNHESPKNNQEILTTSIDILLRSLVTFFESHPSFVPVKEHVQESKKLMASLSTFPIPKMEDAFPFHPSKLKHAFHCGQRIKTAEPFVLRFKRDRKFVQSKPFSWNFLQKLLTKLLPHLEKPEQFKQWKYAMNKVFSLQVIPDLPLNPNYLDTL